MNAIEPRVPARAGRPPLRATGAVLAALTLAVTSGCLHESFADPVRWAPPASGCVQRYPLLDDAGPASGEAIVGCGGVTSSISPYGAGPRFLVGIFLRNATAETVVVDLDEVRLRDPIGIMFRMVELRTGDEPRSHIELAPGDAITCELFFAGPGIRTGRAQRFAIDWSYAVGATEVQRTTVFREVQDPPPERVGFGPWEPDPDGSEKWIYKLPTREPAKLQW